MLKSVAQPRHQKIGNGNTAVCEPCKFHRDGAGPEESVSVSELIPEGSLEEKCLERKSGFGGY